LQLVELVETEAKLNILHLSMKWDEGETVVEQVLDLAEAQVLIKQIAAE
jgi:hypothetical protein